MVKKLIAATYLLALLISCNSGNISTTWGDFSAEFAKAWCAAGDACYPGQLLDRCEAHTVHHLCELRGTCDTVMPDLAAAYDALQQCTDYLSSGKTGCAFLALGIAPEQCTALLSLGNSVGMD